MQLKLWFAQCMQMLRSSCEEEERTAKQSLRQMKLALPCGVICHGKIKSHVLYIMCDIYFYIDATVLLRGIITKLYLTSFDSGTHISDEMALFSSHDHHASKAISNFYRTVPLAHHGKHPIESNNTDTSSRFDFPFNLHIPQWLLQRTTQAINLLYGSGSRKDKGFALLLSKDKTRATNSPLEHTQNLWFYLVLCAIPLTQTKDSLTLVLLFLPVVQNTQGRGTTQQLLRREFEPPPKSQ